MLVLLIIANKFKDQMELKTLILVFTILLTGCASIHKNIDATAEQKKTKLNISAEINNDLSSEYFGMVEFTLENTTGRWLEIESISVDVGDERLRKSTKFTSGNELKAWSKAIKSRNEVRQYNKAVAYSAILGLAAGASAFSDNRTIKNASDSTLALTLGSLTIDQMLTQKDRVEMNRLFPEDHLLAGGQLVPPELFIQSWLLINTTNSKRNELLTDLKLTVTYKSGRSERFGIALYPRNMKLAVYDWQRKMFERKRDSRLGKNQRRNSQKETKFTASE